MTDKKRIEILEEAKNIINIEGGFLCSILYEFIFPDFETQDVFDTITKVFPELIKHKPKNVDWHGAWWGVSDKASRIKVLNAMIKDIKAKQ